MADDSFAIPECTRDNVDAGTGRNTGLALAIGRATYGR